jgi:hypothetical protein
MALFNDKHLPQAFKEAWFKASADSLLRSLPVRL